MNVYTSERSGSYPQLNSHPIFIVVMVSLCGWLKLLENTILWIKMNEWTCFCSLYPRNSFRVFAGEIKSCFTVSVSSGTSRLFSFQKCSNLVTICCFDWKRKDICLDYLIEGTCIHNCEPCNLSEYGVPVSYSLIG